MDAQTFRKYQIEVAGHGPDKDEKLAKILGLTESGIRLCASGDIEIPQYVIQKLRNVVLLYRKAKLRNLGEIP